MTEPRDRPAKTPKEYKPGPRQKESGFFFAVSVFSRPRTWLGAATSTARNEKPRESALFIAGWASHDDRPCARGWGLWPINTLSYERNVLYGAGAAPHPSISTRVTGCLGRSPRKSRTPADRRFRPKRRMHEFGPKTVFFKNL